MQGMIPDSSVPITTGIVPDLGASVVSGNAQSGSALGALPKPKYSPTDISNPIYRPKEFTRGEAVWGGFINNAMGAALLASDLPAYDVEPNFDALAEVELVEKSYGTQMSLVDRDHLLRSRSSSEFMYRQFQIDEKARGAEAMSSRQVWGTLGNAADVDVFAGYGIGALSRAAKLGRATTMTNITVGTAAGTGGTYAYSYGAAPFDTKDAAIHVGLATSLAFLYGTGFKYDKKGKLPDAEPAPTPYTTPTSEVKPEATPRPKETTTKPELTRKQKKQEAYNKKQRQRSKRANKRIVDNPEKATDEDILKAIDDSNDPEFAGNN